MTPDMSAETWLGAARWASGSHTWSGITPAFPAEPAAARGRDERRLGARPGPRAPRVAGRIAERGQGHAPDGREEGPAERIEPELEAAERYEPVHGDGEGAPRDAAEPQDERDEPD